MIADDFYQTRVDILVFKCTLAQISPSSIAISYGTKRELALKPAPAQRERYLKGFEVWRLNP